MVDQKRGHQSSSYICALLNIFADANYSLVRTEISGRYFRAGGITQYPEQRISAQNRFEVKSEHTDQLENLYSLLDPHAFDEMSNQVFQYPFSIPYSSLQRAWEYKNTYREALGWLLIGFESITGSDNVSGSVAMILGSSTDHYSFGQVKDDLADAYDHRSSWAHGGIEREVTHQRNRCEFETTSER